MKRLNIDNLDQRSLAKTIDHSLLRPTAIEKELREGCKIAEKYHTATVCVKPYQVKLASEILADQDVKVSTVIGFPHGGNSARIKSLEAEQAILDGAKELDMVMNIGALKSRKVDLIRNDISRIVENARKHGDILIKVILETCYLTDEEKEVACKLAEKAGVDYVKTSTGFAPTGATVYDVELMYKTVGPRLGVKATGGIRTLDQAFAMIRAGATRIGATAAEQIMEEWLRSQPNSK